MIRKMIISGGELFPENMNELYSGRARGVRSIDDNMKYNIETQLKKRSEAIQGLTFGLSNPVDQRLKNHAFDRIIKQGYPLYLPINPQMEQYFTQRQEEDELDDDIKKKLQ